MTASANERSPASRGRSSNSRNTQPTPAAASARSRSLTCPGGHPRTMEVPWTLMLTGASGEVAGPLTTEPLAALNLLP